jgi:uncharacterized membrane protein
MHLEDTAPLRINTSKPGLLTRDFRWILILSVTLIGLIALEPGFFAFTLLRLLLGFAYVLYVPGYCLTAALFPGADDLDLIERTGLSLGLSVAWVSILALILDRLPWGLRLWPITFGETISALVFMGIATWRRAHLPPGEAYFPDFSWRPRSWWRDLPPADRRVYKFILVALLIAALAYTWVFALPSPVEFMTEFYMLGPEGLADNFPREAAVGQPLNVTVGLVNRERGAHAYKVEVWVEDIWGGRREKVAESTYKQLNPGELLEWPLSWRMPWPGQDQKVEFLLFLDDDPNPYRTLRLFLNVDE